MLHPVRGVFDSVEAFWQGERLLDVEAVTRPDLIGPLYWVAHVERAGVRVHVPEFDADGQLELLGLIRGRPAARQTMQFTAPHLDGGPLPPDALALRVSDVAGTAFPPFWSKGVHRSLERAGEARTRRSA